MKKLSLYLSIALLTQVLLIVTFFLDSDSKANHNLDRLLNLDTEKTTRLLFFDGEAPKPSGADVANIELIKNEHHWLLKYPSKNKLSSDHLIQLPVDQKKLTTLLNHFESLNAHWPVTTTTASHQRFEVSNNQYQKRIQVFQESTLVDDFFIGTSPGFRTTHFRHHNDDNVYTAKINSYELSTNPDDWVDKTLIASQDMTQLKGSDFTLTKHNDTWQLDQTAPSNEPHLEKNTDAVSQAIQIFSNLHILKIITDLPEAISHKVITSFEISTPTHQWTYRMFKDKENFYIQRNDREIFFTISKNDYDTLVQLKRSFFFKKQPSSDDANKDSNSFLNE